MRNQLQGKKNQTGLKNKALDESDRKKGKFMDDEAFEKN